MTETGNLPQSRSILLVEDDMQTMDILASMLAMKFPDVALYTASNGKVGLDLFYGHLTDVVITDLNMPEMSGEEMADKIRTVKPDAKIIVLTGRSTKADFHHEASYGITYDHIILKPVNIHELYTHIEACLAEINQP